MGGAGTKRKKAVNPFDEDVVEYPTVADAGVYQEAYTVAVQVGAMTKEQVDVRGLLIACDAGSLDRVAGHLQQGKAHHNIKIDEVCEMVAFVVSMKRVIMLTENSMAKFKKLLSAKLWQLGTTGENEQFKMDTLVSFIRGVRALK